jgi:hypothetical protein
VTTGKGVKELSEKNAEPDKEPIKEPENYPREMISLVCPCCGELVPVELILNAGGLSSYLDIVGINEGGYTEKDASKRWPVLALEVKVDERRYLDDKLNFLLKKYEDLKIVPEL